MHKEAKTYTTSNTLRNIQSEWEFGSSYWGAGCTSPHAVWASTNSIRQKSLPNRALCWGPAFLMSPGPMLSKEGWEETPTSKWWADAEDHPGVVFSISSTQLGRTGLWDFSTCIQQVFVGIYDVPGTVWAPGHTHRAPCAFQKHNMLFQTYIFRNKYLLKKSNKGKIQKCQPLDDMVSYFAQR